MKLINNNNKKMNFNLIYINAFDSFKINMHQKDEYISKAQFTSTVATGKTLGKIIFLILFSIFVYLLKWNILNALLQTDWIIYLIFNKLHLLKHHPWNQTTKSIKHKWNIFYFRIFLVFLYFKYSQDKEEKTFLF